MATASPRSRHWHRAQKELPQAAQLFGASEAVSESSYTEMTPYDHDQYTRNVAAVHTQILPPSSARLEGGVVLEHLWRQLHQRRTAARQRVIREALSERVVPRRAIFPP